MIRKFVNMRGVKYHVTCNTLTHTKKGAKETVTHFPIFTASRNPLKYNKTTLFVNKL